MSRVVVERNPNGQILDVAELLKKDENNNEIFTDENYKIKVQKLVLLYSAVHAIKLHKIIDLLRVFWELCERVDERCKKSFLETLFYHHEIFVNMSDALQFIYKFKSKSPLTADDNLNNEVTKALNHLEFLSNTISLDNERIRFELKSAYNSIKQFFASHFRPVPNYIIDDQNCFSTFYLLVKSTINNNNTTLDDKLLTLTCSVYPKMIEYKYCHINILDYRCFIDSL
ncbi:uncharacterized protein LOC126895130 isoform X2 [Daktulosphaira vitifoliae]|nr:uncharacterized protein LOC126895130 isoform X2 [Daktulosphaira vitifoliae]XP_050522609.1 uncharacterized protein LOC126895130 isoform X2 [Daktulosphaira vitifoliae]XP_050522610.1 uncharacterized protein LOC126895130 isoform X2 [Daktulosphaira vitifoliae]XP_050522611.1 uncharacterized protein LOC126895130 isoform X2 [Daktulosphaira vitifoliae]